MMWSASDCSWPATGSVRSRCIIARQGPLFAFASELSAISRHSAFTVRLDSRSVQKFFAYGFIPAPNALFENCEKLPGGCSAVFDLRTQSLSTKRYWRFLIETEEPTRRSEDDLAEELRALVTQAVDRRLVADVPVGFFLSGGVDSTAIVAAAALRLPKDKVEAFTLGVLEPSFDETAPAAAAATALGVAHFTERLDLDVARSRLPDVLGRLDEPSGDPSILPTALLAEFARTRVTVALSGDGADELFAGYDPFKALAPARLYNAFVPRPLHALLRETVNKLPMSDGNMSLDFKLRRTLGGLGRPAPYWNPVWLGPLDPEAQADIFHLPITPEDLYSEALDLWSAGCAPALMDKTLEFYSNFYLQDGILQKVDRASMISSLETRSPFLDNDLVEFCRRLPHRYKFRNGQRKYLLKRALLGLVPEEVLKRPKKGFGMPVSKWLRTLPKPALIRSTPDIRTAAVDAAWADHQGLRADNRLFLWGWLSLQTLDAEGVTPSAATAKLIEAQVSSTPPARPLVAPL